MHNHRVGFFAILAVLLALAQPTAQAQPGPLQIGIAESMPFYAVELNADWERYLSDRLHRQVEILHRASHSDILNLLVQDRIGFAWVCPAHYQRHRDKITLVATPLFQGQPRFQVLLLAPTDAAVSSIEDLRDKVIAYAEPDSNLGGALIKLELLARGEDPDRFFRRAFYTGDHTKVAYAVADGLAHGGVVMDQTWEILREREPEVAARTRVVWRSGWRPMPPIVAGSGADPATVQALREALLAMPEDALGRTILGRLHFDRFAVGLESIYQAPAASPTAVGVEPLPACGE